MAICTGCDSGRETRRAVFCRKQRLKESLCGSDVTADEGLTATPLLLTNMADIPGHRKCPQMPAHYVTAPIYLPTPLQLAHCQPGPLGTKYPLRNICCDMPLMIHTHFFICEDSSYVFSIQQLSTEYPLFFVMLLISTWFIHFISLSYRYRYNLIKFTHMRGGQKCALRVMFGPFTVLYIHYSKNVKSVSLCTVQLVHASVKFVSKSINHLRDTSI